MFVKWDRPPGRDEKFKQTEIAKTSELRWRQEYECEFLSSDPLLINTMTIARLTVEIDQIKPIGTVGEITFYKQILPQMTYLVSVDCATGTGSDFTTIEVFNFPHLEQVAEWRSNTTSSPMAYQFLKRILRAIDRTGSTAYFTIENNGVGEGMLSLYEDDEDPPNAMLVSNAESKRPGMTTTPKTKMKGCVLFREMVERNQLHIKSKHLLFEIKNFVRRGGSYAAKSGSTDDLIMAVVNLIRMIEEIASFDQDAYDKLHLFAYEGVDTTDYSDDDVPLGFIF